MCGLNKADHFEFSFNKPPHIALCKYCLFSCQQSLVGVSLKSVSHAWEQSLRSGNSFYRHSLLQDIQIYFQRRSQNVFVSEHYHAKLLNSSKGAAK